jgi:hypothetical protein
VLGISCLTISTIEKTTVISIICKHQLSTNPIRMSQNLPRIFRGICKTVTFFSK